MRFRTSLRALAFGGGPWLAIALGTAPARAAEAECSAAYDQALEARKVHALRAARNGFVGCAQATCPEIVRTECLRELRENEAAIPTVAIRVHDPNGRDLVDVRVFFDDELLTEKLDGRAIRVDPGMHTFRLVRGGRPPVVLDRVLVAEGEKSRVLTVEMPADPPSPAPSPSPVPSPSQPDASGPSHVPSYVAFGAAGIATVIAVTSGVVALDEAASLRSGCPDRLCPPDRHDTLVTARTLSTVSTVSFIATAAFVGVGLAAWFLTPQRPAPAAVAARGACIRALDLCADLLAR